MISEDKKRTLVSPILLIASSIIVIAGLRDAQTIVIPVILALFISIICIHPIKWLEKKKIPYGLAMILVLVFAGFLVVILGGIIGNSLSSFMKDVPKYEENLLQMVGSAIDNLNAVGVEINNQQLLDLIDPGKMLSFTAGAVGEIGSIMSDSFLIMLITIFILLEAKTFFYKTELVEKIHGKSLDYLNKIGVNIRHYLSIKTVISILTGILIWLWLLIVGVDYAILWGVIAFLLNYIPSIGSIIAAVPTILLALVQLGIGGMIWTGVGYLVVNMVIGNIIEPKVMGKGLGLSTLVVFLSLIIWGFILGTAGMFLSIPLTITIKIMLEQNERTQWIAVLLGTEDETKQILKQQ